MRETITAILICLFCACGVRSGSKQKVMSAADANAAYEQLLKTESQRPDEMDSIFYGVHLKMTEKMFFDHCSKMFKKGTFTGGFDYQVVVQLGEPFSRPVTLKFYPTFEKPFISKLNCHFSFTNLNAFDKTDRADRLMQELIPVLMQWYGGNDFIGRASDSPIKGPEFVKLDANRKITASESDDGTTVNVVYEDLKPLY